MTTRQAIKKANELIEYLEADLRPECIGVGCDGECSPVGDHKCTTRDYLKKLVKCLNNEI